MSTISDSHVRSDNPANPDVINMLEESVGEISALPAKPPLGMRYAPGERALNDERQLYCERDGRGTEGADWYSFLMTRKIIRSAGTKNAGNRPRRQPCRLPLLLRPEANCQLLQDRQPGPLGSVERGGGRVALHQPEGAAAASFLRPHSPARRSGGQLRWVP